MFRAIAVSCIAALSLPASSSQVSSFLINQIGGIARPFEDCAVTDDSAANPDPACRLDSIIGRAAEQLAELDLSVLDHGDADAWLVRDLDAVTRLGLKACRALHQALSGSPAREYMATIGSSVRDVREPLDRLVDWLHRQSLLAPRGMVQLLQPLAFFAGLEEAMFAAVHMDSSFGHTWMPAWRRENATGEMLDSATFDAVFRRALAELAEGMQELVPWGEWWPISGTLLSLLRHGDVVGELSDGKVDASVGKDMELVVGAAGPEEWAVLSQRMVELFSGRFAWDCRPIQIFGRDVVGAPPRNDSVVCRTPQRLIRCMPHERFCRYTADFQITGYFRDAREQTLFVHRLGGAAVHHSPFKGGAPPWGSVYPLQWCAAPGLRIPCPAQPEALLQGSIDLGGGACLALPWITRDRRVDDWRNHDLSARGLSAADAAVLRRRAEALQAAGFANFGAHLDGRECADVLMRLEEGPQPVFKAEPLRYIAGSSMEVPPDLDDRGVEDALEWHANQFGKNVEMFCHVWHDDPEKMAAGAALDLALYQATLRASSWMHTPKAWRECWLPTVPDYWWLGLGHNAVARGLWVDLLMAYSAEMTLAALVLVAANNIFVQIPERDPAAPPPDRWETIQHLGRQHAEEGPLLVGPELLRALRAAVDSFPAEEDLDPLTATKLFEVQGAEELYRVFLARSARLPQRPADSREAPRWRFDCLEQLLAWTLETWLRRHSGA